MSEKQADQLLNVAETYAANIKGFTKAEHMLLDARLVAPRDSVEYARYMALQGKITIIRNYAPRRLKKRDTARAHSFREALGQLRQATRLFRRHKELDYELDCLVWRLSFDQNANAAMRLRALKLVASPVRIHELRRVMFAAAFPAASRKALNRSTTKE